MSKTRACYNCLHYEQVPMSQIHDETVTYRGFAPRCTKGLNPSLADAPQHMPTRWEGKFEPDDMASFCDSYLWAPVGFAKLRSHCTRRLLKEPRLSTIGLSEKFVQWFDRGQDYRIKIERGVNLKYTEYGYVSISTGWQPVFLLIRSARSKGSSVCLEDTDDIVGVKYHKDKRYRPVL